MLLTVALVVLGAAIFVFFSQEFGKAFKKLFKYPGVKLCLPVLLATLLIVYYEPMVLWFLMKIREGLKEYVEIVVDIIPFTTGDYFLAYLTVLLTLTLLPVVALNYWCVRKSFVRYKHPYLLSSLIWIFVAILLTI